MRRKIGVAGLSGTGLLMLFACSDVATYPEAVAVAEAPETEQVSSADASAGLLGSLEVRDGARGILHSFTITRAALGSPVVSPDLAELRRRLAEAGGGTSPEARIAAAFASDNPRERRTALAAFETTLSVRPEGALGGPGSRNGAIDRDGQQWIHWSLGSQGPLFDAGAGSLRADAEGRNRWRSGSSSSEQRIAASGECIDCGGYEDYDPYYNPEPVVWEMAAATAFMNDLEFVTYSSGTPEECYGYRTAFHVSLSTTLSAAAVATLAAYARMPNTAYTYGKLAGQGAFATYVAWEFLESCKVQFRKK